MLTDVTKWLTLGTTVYMENSRNFGTTHLKSKRLFKNFPHRALILMMTIFDITRTDRRTHTHKPSTVTLRRGLMIYITLATVIQHY